MYFKKYNNSNTTFQTILLVIASHTFPLKK